MKKVFIIICISLSYTTVCQVPIKEMNTQEKKFFQTFVGLTEYFKNHKTIPLSFHESSSYSKDEAFYEEVINKYFDRNKTNQIFMKDTSVIGFEGKMDFMRHTLNGADYFVDIIPTDSIFVRKFNSEKYPNSLEVYVMVNNKEIPILLCHFDSESALLLSLSGGASPRNEEFMSFLRRQKKYYEFPDPLGRN